MFTQKSGLFKLKCIYAIYPNFSHRYILLRTNIVQHTLGEILKSYDFYMMPVALNFPTKRSGFYWCYQLSHPFPLFLSGDILQGVFFFFETTPIINTFLYPCDVEPKEGMNIKFLLDLTAALITIFISLQCELVLSAKKKLIIDSAFSKKNISHFNIARLYLAIVLRII